jgi:GT2 family glycosyltransferase
MNIEQFKNIGFFDDNFFIYFEEIDLCRRLKNNGKKIYLDPNIKIFHEGGSSHNVEVNYQMELSRNWHWMWSTFYYNKKYNGFIISLFKIFPKLIKSLFKIILYSIFFNKFKMLIYFYRLSGILNSILCKKSWYRPKV